MSPLEERYARIAELARQGERFFDGPPEKLEAIFKEEEALLKEADVALKSVTADEAPALRNLVQSILKIHESIRTGLLARHAALRVKYENLGVAKLNLKHLKGLYKAEPHARFMDKET